MDKDQHPGLFPLKIAISSDDSSYCSPEIIVFGTKNFVILRSKICCKYIYIISIFLLLNNI